MNPSDDDPFTQALRGDLPGPSDEARVRSRLVTAGVLAGAVAAPIGSAAAAGGIAAKVVALPLAVKVGASLAVVGLVTVPVVSHVTNPSSSSPSKVMVARTVEPRAAASAPAPASKPVGAEVAEPSKPLETTAEPVSPARESARAMLREPAKGAGPIATSPLPSVASFEEVTPAPRPLDEGSLRAETALMERALSALKRDDVGAARAALAEHARRFPNGHLVRERERALERTLGKETERHAQ